MQRLIDANALTLRSEMVLIRYGKGCLQERLAVRYEDIENAPTIDAEPHWIPCSERLPEFDVKVLAYVKNKDPEGRFNKDGIYTAELKDKVPMHDPEGKKNFWGIPGYDSEWTVWAWSYFTEPNVLAWMPLPKPYEGDNE